MWRLTVNRWHAGKTAIFMSRERFLFLDDNAAIETSYYLSSLQNFRIEVEKSKAMEKQKLQELGQAVKRLVHKDPNQNDGWSFDYEMIRKISELTKCQAINNGWGHSAGMEEVDNVLRAIAELYGNSECKWVTAKCSCGGSNESGSNCNQTAGGRPV